MTLELTGYESNIRVLSTYTISNVSFLGLTEYFDIILGIRSDTKGDPMVANQAWAIFVSEYLFLKMF